VDRSGEKVNKKRKEFEKEAMPHLDALYRSAYQLAQDPTAAEDLVQDAMLQAYRFWDKYQKGTNCRAWLLRIQRNLYINQYRKKTRQPSKVDYEDLDRYYDQVVEPAIVDSNLNPAEELFNNLVDDEIIDALEELPEEFRDVVILSDMQDLSYKEIADQLDIPIGTVRSRLSRGRKLLQSMLYEFAVKGGFIRDGKVVQ
jgi:RNA polymerase sigma-70 factor, ECF subfamily